MPSKRLVSTAVLCLALAAGTTACGGDEKDEAKAPAVATLDVDRLSAEEIEKAAKEALTSATSVKITGEITGEEGQMKIDMALDTKGQCVGSMSMPGMGSFEIISNGTEAWLKPDAAFWKSQGGANGDQAAELFKGRYLSGAMSDPEMKELAGFCNLSAFTKSITEDDEKDKGKTTTTKGSAGSIGGQKTFTLKQVDDGEESTMHIATTGKFYPLRLEQTGGKEPGKMDFTDYDKPLEVKAPPADNVVDFTKFRSQFPAAV